MLGKRRVSEVKDRAELADTIVNGWLMFETGK